MMKMGVVAKERSGVVVVVGGQSMAGWRRRLAGNREEEGAEDHFDGILKTTLSPKGFSKRIGIHTIQSISGFAAQDALLSRHWSINSRTILYVLSGEGQVQVVSNNDVNLQSREVVVVEKKQKVRWIVFWIIHASKEGL
ncbi:11S globulin precursor [Tanacetum coccineum]